MLVAILFETLIWSHYPLSTCVLFSISRLDDGPNYENIAQIVKN